VEERTIGPSLGAENIALGMTAVKWGMGVVLIFMLFYYRAFGLAANIALAFNVLLIVAVMSLLRSEEHTSELQSRENLVCRLLLVPRPPRPTLFPYTTLFRSC